MILLLDNYDSFVHTLAGYVRELGHGAIVIRNDAVTLDEVERLGASHIIISPGPGTPSTAGISTAVVRRLGAATPILGVCLGHQCIGEAYGARVLRTRPRHGQASAVRHHGTGLFAGLASPFQAARYHSLVVERSSLPGELEITAESDDGTIMALAHRTNPVVGVQFHPESVLSEHGHLLIDRFLHW
jgi:glutamine amidotransferase of anthranilate synthase or aminodeoxychorismate synthase